MPIQRMELEPLNLIWNGCFHAHACRSTPGLRGCLSPGAEAEPPSERRRLEATGLSPPEVADDRAGDEFRVEEDVALEAAEAEDRCVDKGGIVGPGETDAEAGDGEPGAEGDGVVACVEDVEGEAGVGAGVPV